MRWWTATPSRRELVTPIFLLNTWEHYIQWDLWKLDFWDLLGIVLRHSTDLPSPCFAWSTHGEQSSIWTAPANKWYSIWEQGISGAICKSHNCAKPFAVQRLGGKILLGFTACQGQVMQMQVHKMIRSRLETCWENIHTLGDGKEHLRFSGFFYLSFNRHGFATAFLRHVALTKPQPSRMHCKKVKNFSQRLWIWAALCCKGFDNSTSRKYDEHSTSRHSKHTPLEGSLSSELVCLWNKSGSFQ